MISRKRHPNSLYFLTVKYSHKYVIQLHSGFSMSKRFWLLLLQVDFPILMGTEPFSKATIIYLCRKHHCCVFLCKPCYHSGWLWSFTKAPWLQSAATQQSVSNVFSLLVKASSPLYFLLDKVVRFSLWLFFPTSPATGCCPPLSLWVLLTTLLTSCTHFSYVSS